MGEAGTTLEDPATEPRSLQQGQQDVYEEDLLEKPVELGCLRESDDAWAKVSETSLLVIDGSHKPVKVNLGRYGSHALPRSSGPQVTHVRWPGNGPKIQTIGFADYMPFMCSHVLPICHLCVFTCFPFAIYP